MQYRFVVITLCLFASVNFIRADVFYYPEVIPGFIKQEQDTAEVQPKRSSSFGVNAVIFAKAEDSIVFHVKEKKMRAHGESSLKYKNSGLRSANVFVDFETNQIDALPNILTDDSTGKTTYSGTPILNEGAEIYEGLKLKYNYKTQQGYISAAKTETDGSVYKGAQVKKIDKNTYFVKDGIFTTCNADTPHFHFYASQMKVILKQEIDARWIWLHFGGVPFPIPLPFAVFPNQSGRRSGIIPPAYGERYLYGQYFSHFGYFWAISDFMDLTLTGDYYTRGSYAFNSRYRYVKRYEYTGQVEANYANWLKGEKYDPDYARQQDYRLSMVHNQTINPTTRLDANLYFQSNTYNQNTSVRYEELLTQDIISSATFNKTWEGSGTNFSLNYRRTQNLQSGRIDENLPNATFTKSLFYPFKSKKKKIGTGSGWYENIGLNYSGNFLNRRIKNEGELNIRGGAQHNISVSSSQKIGYFNFNPNFRYTEKWYNKAVSKSVVRNFNNTQDSIATGDIKKINMVRYFDLGASASTKIYGIFPFSGTLGIDAFRHTINPSISYTYTPDFSEPHWGYWEELQYQTSSGITHYKYNKFEKEVFGGAPSGESQRININIGNVFELKTAPDLTDTTAKAKKFQLLNFGASTSYNFAADSLKLSDLSLSYRTSVGSLFNFYGSSRYTFYEYYQGRRINQFLISKGKGLARLTAFSINVSLSLNADLFRAKQTNKEKDEQPIEDEGIMPLTNQTLYHTLYGEAEPDFEIPWSLMLNANYSETKENPLIVNKYSTLSASFNVNLTPTWNLSFSGSYDLQRKLLSAPSVRISKDLHCWIMNLDWNPLGLYRGYRFEIRIKSSMLQDLKVTKSGGLYSR